METIEFESGLSSSSSNSPEEGASVQVPTSVAEVSALEGDLLPSQSHCSHEESSIQPSTPVLKGFEEGEQVEVSSGDAGAEIEAAALQDNGVSQGNGQDETSAISNSPEDVVADRTVPAPAASPNHLPGMLASAVPSHKRFSAVNINKKFLEKNSNSSTSGVGHTSAGSTSSKQSGVIARPTPQSASSHSRLVTAKLTGTPLSSNSPGQGWSRPNSAAPPAIPPASTNVLSGNNPTPAGASSPQGPPQPQPIGKVIQPQVRGALKLKEGSGGPGKPAWGSVQSASAQAALRAQNDFPTAAEAAKGPMAKVSDMKDGKVTAEGAAQKQARLETADAFRGVHLDPNAHHWDEMEEDDSDFLDGVIEFGDGTQYKIQVDDIANKNAPALGENGQDARIQQNGILPPDHPVSKEERFADDFDRSWPRTRSNHADTLLQEPPKHQTTHAPFTTPTTSSTPSGQTASSHDTAHSRVLFNDRLNRLEPYSNGNRQNGPGTSPNTPQIAHRRDSHSEFVTSPTDSRRGKETLPHGLSSNLQVLHKPGTTVLSDSMINGAPPAGPWLSSGDMQDTDVGSDVGGGSHPADKPRERQRGRRDSTAMPPPPVPLARVHSRETDRSQRGPTGPRLVSPVGRDRPPHSWEDHRGRFGPSMAMGPSPFPRAPSSIRDKSRDSGRQLAPHLPDMPPPPLHLRRPPSRDMQPNPELALRTRSTSISSSVSAHPPTHHSMPHGSSISPASEKSVQNLPSASSVTDTADVDALRKAFLQASAERAKQRRQQEEEERAKAQDRARKKAAELEAKMTATATEGDKKKVEAETNDGGKTLDAKTKASETEVLRILEEVATSSHPPQHIHGDRKGVVSSQGTDVMAKKTLWNAPTSSQPVDRPHPHEALPALTRQPSYIPPSASSQAESWRSKASALPPPNIPPTDQVQRITLQPPPTLPEPPSFDVQPGEELEVVDFRDLAKLVGDSKSEATYQSITAGSPSVSKPMRPVASDFFDDGPAAHETRTFAQAEPEYWRRRAIHMDESIPDQSLQNTAETITPSAKLEEEHAQPPPKDITFGGSDDAPVPPVLLSSPSRKSSISAETPSPSWPSQTVPVPPNFASLRSPRTPSAFREAPMSALNDTMSRIKGALDGMQSPLTPAGDTGGVKTALGVTSVSQESSATSFKKQPAPIIPTHTKENRWMPPALRTSRPSEFSPPRETFDISHPELPSTPRPFSNKFMVHLPNKSRPLEPLSKKQFHLWRSPASPVRWDILSWDPPVEGMSRRNFSLNEILFRKPQIIKNKFRFKVALPNARPLVGTNSSIQSQFFNQPGPKVSIPTGGPSGSKPSGTGAFGRPRVPDGSSWRKSTVQPSNLDKSSASSPVELNVTSCSPPPDPPSNLNSDSTEPKQDPPLPIKPGSAKSKTQLKMPEGADVAFYRDVRKNSDNMTPVTRPVSFTVNSELETVYDETLSAPSHENDDAPSVQEDRLAISAIALNIASSSSSTLVEPSQEFLPSNNEVITVSSKLGMCSDLTGLSKSQTKVESMSLEDTNSSINQNGNPPVTPASQSPLPTWGKSPLAFHVRDTPARAPDPDHLKAVWSQASDKKVHPAVNSLKGIADDLIAVPFTLQEVKSEDGGTPPPAPVPPPSRMSASEVTRAFQTVPAGPGNASTPPRTLPFAPPMPSPNNTHPLARTPGGSGPQPAANSSMRPPFAGYPSPITSHSPSPTLIYAHHPPPNQIPGTPSHPYAQPMWMPVSGHLPQQSPQMMRAQPPSSYNPQMLSYTSPGGPSAIYPLPSSQPPQQNASGQYPNGAHPRMTLVSPVMPHATSVHHMSMYAGSPILVHSSPHSSTPMAQPYPGAVGMGRGSVPVRSNSYDNRPPLPAVPQATSGSRFPNHNPGYTHVPPASFIRPTW